MPAVAHSQPKSIHVLPSSGTRSTTTVTTTVVVGSSKGGDAAEAVATSGSAGSGRRRPASHHSRSASDVGGGGGAADGIRNLNRWSSSSTTSSRGHASPLRNSFQKRSSGYGRRASLDAVILLSPTTTAAPPLKPATTGPPSKLPTPGGRPAAVGATRRPSVDQTAGNSTISRPTATARNQTVQQQQQQQQQQQPPYVPRFYSKGSIDAGRGWDTYRLAQTTVTEKPTKSGTNDEMGRDINGTDSYQPKGHARTKSQPTKGSTDTTSSARSRDRKSSSQKQMLSRALQKANTAVQLDNAQNFEGAREAYAEACDLLQQVLMRTAGDDDRKKLEAIRKTYTSRIDELDQMGLVRKNDGKALPARPESSEVRPSNEFSPAGDHMDDVVVIETATVTRIVKDNSLDTRPGGKVSPSPPQQQRVPSRQAQRTEPDRPRLGGPPANGTAVSRGTPSLTVSTSREQFDALSSLRQPMDSKYMPPPLSPRRPVSPAKANDPAGSEPTIRTDFSGPGRPYAGNAASVPFRNEEPQSTSWLDPDDDGGASPVSSVHSISPVTGIRRRHIRAPSGDTEAEFDAALDAAVEAAYDDGFEPMDPAEPMGPVEPLGPVEPVKVEDDDDVIARALRKVELAKERVRQTERELALEEERRRQMQRSRQQQSRPAPTDFYDGSDSEEEERLLEQITRGDITDVLSFSAQARPALPRQSDSSGTTNRTWHSSLVSNPPTATTTSSALSTVAELDSLPSIPKSASPLPPPPSQALPAPPPLAAAQGTQAPTQAAGVQGVRNRRLSGQPPAQLKIETARLGGPVTDIASAAPRDVPRPAERPRPPSRPASAGGNAGGRGGEPATPPTVDRASRDLEALAASAGGSESPTPASSARQAPYLRKVQSSTSLHSIRAGRNMSRTNLDETDGGVSDGSPGTPSSSHFGSTTRLPMLPNLPTPPPGSSFRDKLSSGSEAGFRLFEGGFHASDTAGSANPLLVDAPVPLEPCPTEALLRPFWLMRCLYQTLAHPRGGYLSSKLFVPKDVWKVKGVKIKNVEDKIASCDLLTAALQKLERVDTCDADAVLVEMQAFEEVVKQVRTTLSRKLGGEVGNQGLANTLFKDSSVSPDLDLATMVPRSASTASKSSSFSWRRLRSKNSAGGLGNTYGGGGGRTASGGDGQKEDMIVDTLPMTAHPTSRPPKRDVALAQFGGPHQNYMNSLARLFDAAQAVDQIARQIDDPGLKHANETQVGLELSTRAVADFFAFYICRFVLTDLNILLEKFIKRGTEWVLA